MPKAVRSSACMPPLQTAMYIQYTTRSNEEGRFTATWKKRQEIQHGCRLYYFVAGATDFRFLSPGALWAVSSTGNHSTAEPYRFRHISYLISSSTIYWYPPSRFPSAELATKWLTENSNRARRRRGSTPERPTATATKTNASISNGGRQQVVFHSESTPAR
jgi:hypothetical protein